MNVYDLINCAGEKSEPACMGAFLYIVSYCHGLGECQYIAT